jgi:hypothetical protein
MVPGNSASSAMDVIKLTGARIAVNQIFGRKKEIYSPLFED